MSFYYGDPSVYAGIPVHLNENAPRGKVYVFSDPTTLMLHPIDALYIEHPGETDWQWENIYRAQIVAPLLTAFDNLIEILRLDSETERWKLATQEFLEAQAKGRIRRDDAHEGMVYHHVLDVDRLVHS